MTTRSERLRQIIDATIELMAQKGFRQTQVADVAARAGVSQGTVYNYVQSKEALFLLCVETAIDGTALDNLELPIAERPMSDVLDRLGIRLAEVTRITSLEQAIGEPTVDDAAAEVDRVTSEIFAFLAATRLLATALERSASEMADLALLFHERGRMSLVEQFADYLDHGAATGRLEPVPDSMVWARAQIETINLFARHRHHDLQLASLDEETARRTAVLAVQRALGVHVASLIEVD
jgi:AcrR family transcriptional regulator